jgi:hypothetical protein
MKIPSKFRPILLFVILLLLFFFQKTNAQSAWDTLYLRNGQKVYGELKRISLGIVRFDMEGINVADLKMNKIKTIKATSQRYRIETINKKVFFSTIQPSNRTGYILVVDSTGGAEMPMDYISYLSYYSDKKNLFEGNVSAGYNYTKSSDIGRVNMDATLNYILKKYIIKLNASAILTSNKSEWYRERETVSLSGTYLIDSKWKAVGFLSYQRNKELGLESRFQQGAGMGYYVLSTQHTRIAAISGLVINQEKSFEDEKAGFTSEVPIQLDFKFFKFSKPELSVSFYQNAYFSLTQQGRLRLDSELRTDWKVISDFTVNLRFYYNYDNKPLSGTGVNYDYGIVFGIGYKWD